MVLLCKISATEVVLLKNIKKNQSKFVVILRTFKHFEKYLNISRKKDQTFKFLKNLSCFFTIRTF